MMLNVSWREKLVRRLRQMCLTAAPGESVAMLQLRRNLDVDAFFLATAGDFHLFGRAW